MLYLYVDHLYRNRPLLQLAYVLIHNELIDEIYRSEMQFANWLFLVHPYVITCHANEHNVIRMIDLKYD